ncbi:MAG: acetyl-CoA carboxylase biotin carboxyl carrier protein [Thermoleophilia bacterium]|jgi:oxaloacetate decarboxylase alpha subunit
MAPVRKVGLADTSLRSLVNLTSPSQASIGTLLPALLALDRAGFCAVEACGGMTVDHSLRVLEESPFERLRALVTHVTATPAQVTLWGRCLLGFRPYSWTVVEEFVREAVDCGVGSFLVYEPLNELAALERMTAIIREVGAQVTLAMIQVGGSAVRPAESAALARKMADMGPDAICIKTAGVLGPRMAADVVTAIRDVMPLRLEVDFDNGSGLAVMAAVAAVEAGADVVHCSAAPQWLDPSALPLTQLLPALQDAGVSIDADIDAIVAFVESVASLVTAGGTALLAHAGSAAARAGVDFRRLTDMPGELLLQVSERLRDHGGITRLAEILAEIERVRKEIGGVTLVAPIGQLVATQAILNVVYGGRWRVVSDEMKAFLRGEYGRSTTAVAPEVARAVLGDGAEACGTTVPSAPSFDDFRVSIGDLAQSAADVLLHALAPGPAGTFLTKRRAALQVDLSTSLTPDEAYATGLEDHWRDLGPERIRDLVVLLETSTVDELTVENQGTRVTLRKSAQAAVESPTQETAISLTQHETAEPTALIARESQSTICASMVGTFYRSPAPGMDPYVEVGQRVEKGDTLCVLEAMKLMNEMLAEEAGTIAAVLVEDGAAVEYGQPLFVMDTDE